MTEFINALLSIGTIVLLGITFILIILSIFKKQSVIVRIVAENAILVAGIASIMSIIGSLIYSNVIGYTPCDLCWWQRIFLYPLAIVFSIAYFKKDSKIFSYTVPLTIIGTLFSLYHNYIYYGGYSPLPCSAAASCTQRFVFEFGFVTIPLMAISIFAFILTVSFIHKKFSPKTLA